MKQELINKIENTNVDGTIKFFPKTRKRNDVREKTEEIINLYQKDLIDVIKISKLFNCHADLIYTILRENNVMMSQSERKKILFNAGKLTYKKRMGNIWERTEEIIDLYKNKLMNTQEIAKIIGCNPCLIQRILRKNKACFGQPERITKLYHSGKIKVWNDGLTKETDERVKNLCEKNLGQIRQKTKEWHKKNKESKNPIGMYHKKTIEKTKILLRKSTKERWKNMNEDDYKNICEKISNALTGKARPDMIGNKIMSNYIKEHPETIERLKEQRRNQIFPKVDTKIEVKIQNFLKQLGIDFMTHQYIKEIEHGYQCDILVPSMNLVIETDGDYWHKYPIGNDIDHVRTSELISKGFKVLRLWECEINKMSIDKFQELIKTK
ncbi:MAG: DUF559 domain-containing protein [Candidatus Woesearchaeota archaeon]|jgi:very-short-patch-repair endonuclease/predicted HTH domain antitoxin